MKNAVGTIAMLGSLGLPAFARVLMLLAVASALSGCGYYNYCWETGKSWTDEEYCAMALSLYPPHIATKAEKCLVGIATVMGG